MFWCLPEVIPLPKFAQLDRGLQGGRRQRTRSREEGIARTQTKIRHKIHSESGWIKRSCLTWLHSTCPTSTTASPLRAIFGRRIRKREKKKFLNAVTYYIIGLGPYLYNRSPGNIYSIYTMSTYDTKKNDLRVPLRRRPRHYGPWMPRKARSVSQKRGKIRLNLERYEVPLAPQCAQDQSQHVPLFPRQVHLKS